MSNETNVPFKVGGDRKISTTFSVVGSVVVFVAVSVWTVAMFVGRLDAIERAVRSSDETHTSEMKALRSAMVLREPFYAWTGQLRYEMRRIDAVIPEPRVFMEPRSYSP